MKKRLLITGASGFIGKALMKNLASDFDVYGTYHSNKVESLIYLDITDAKEVISVFERIKPDIVIHAAALPNVNYCETHKKQAREINLNGTINIINACKLYNSKLAFISSDYVFDGRNGPYSEEDETNPLNVYGKLKLEAEEVIKRNLKDFLIIRTTNIYGFDKYSKNFVMFVIKKLKAGEKVVVANDQFGNPTYVDDLCLAINELLAKGKSGIYNVTGPDNISREDFTKIIAEVWGFDKGLVSGKSTKKLGQDAPRPKKSGFIIDKITRELKTEMRSTRDGLELMKERSVF